MLLVWYQSIRQIDDAKVSKQIDEALCFFIS